MNLCLVLCLFDCLTFCLFLASSVEGIHIEKCLYKSQVDVNDTYGTYDTVGEEGDYNTVEDTNDHYDSMN